MPQRELSACQIKGQRTRSQYIVTTPVRIAPVLTKSAAHFIHRMNVTHGDYTNTRLVIQRYFTFLAAGAPEGQINDYVYRESERL